MLFFTPGPVKIDNTFKDNLKDIHHRSSEFKEIFSSTRKLLVELIGLDEAILLTGSGTSGMEAVINSVSSNHMLIVSNGKFGDVFIKLAEALGKKYSVIRYKEGDSLNVSEVVKHLKNHNDIDMLLVQATETSTGCYNDITELGNEVKSYNSNIVFVVDAITHALIYDITGVKADVFISASQKSYMQPAGVTVINLSKLAISRLVSRGYSLNLKSHLEVQIKNEPLVTPATNIIVGIYFFLKKIKEFGVSNFYNEISLRAKAFRGSFNKANISLLPKYPSDAVIVLNCQDANKAKEVLQKRYNVMVAGGQRTLKGKILRISNIGFIEPYVCSLVADSIERVYSDMGYINYKGICGIEFNNIYYGEKL